MEHLTCSRWFVQAFARVLTSHPFVSEETLDWLRVHSRLPRVGVWESYEAVAQWVRETGDDDLGLRAGALVRFGEAGAVDFALRTASNLRCSMDVASRHAYSWSDAIEPMFEPSGNRALIRLQSKLTLPRAAADFISSVWYAHVRDLLPPSAQLQVSFAHAEPASTLAYERVFPGAELQFDAPWYAFAFDLELAELPLLGAEPVLHAAHCAYLDYVRTHHSNPPGFAAQVRELVAYELRRAKPSSSSIARRMHISRRTLVRRLREEATSFKAELDQLRRERALELVARPELTLLEISTSLRFSHIQVFHRAFRRWTDQTPAQFRRRRATGDCFLVLPKPSNASDFRSNVK